eukprot:6483996-Amphidinium_carterae.1
MKGLSGSWSITLHPATRAQSSKVGLQDEVVALDLARHRVMFPLLQMRCMKWDPSALLVSVPQQKVAGVMKMAWNGLGLKCPGGGHPYRLRHGGASWDAHEEARSLLSIQQRGRWATFQSLR